MKLIRIESIADLRQRAAAWDDLWWRSDSHLPSQRAELAAQWLEHFAPQRRFVALAVEDGGQLVAALPLIDSRWAKLLRVGEPSNNCWSNSGELLLDRQADGPAAIEALVRGLRQLPWPLVICEGVNLDLPDWKLLRAALDKARLPAAEQLKYVAGLIDITHDWPGYVAAWSSNHRRAMKKLTRLAEERGQLQLEHYSELTGDEAARRLACAFEIEDKSWKGAAGTSVLRTPKMLEFFVRQAQQLAEWGQAELYILTHAGRAIAFDFCYVAKGVTSSHKIGYDESFRELGPSQLLRCLQLEGFHRQSERTVVDTLGVLDEAKAKWCTRSYRVSRLMFSTGGWIGDAAVAFYARLWPRVRRMLGRHEAPLAEWTPGATRCLEADVADGSPAAAAELTETAP
jgi:CelD/BcsL family acetyltransferase involved in cellulose biosynthesis